MPATVTRRARPLTVLLAALLLAAGVLTPARPVEAAGVTTHAWMAESALDHIENQDLRTLLEANHDQLVAGAMFPDAGYIGDYDWGEEAHWQRFIDSYADQLLTRDDCGDPTVADGPCAPMVAHLMGVLAHGIGDEVWDWLFEPYSPDLDEYYLHDDFGPFSSDGGQELTMDIVAIGDHGRPRPNVPALPSLPALIAAFEGSGHAGTTEADFALHWFGQIVWDAITGWLPSHLEPVRDAMPWMSENLVTAPGGVEFGGEAIAGAMDSLWGHLLGERPATEVSVAYPADGQRGIPASGWVRSYQPGSNPGRGGARTRIAASLTYSLPYLGATGGAPVSNMLPGGSMTISERDTGTVLPNLSGFPRAVPYGADAGERMIGIQPGVDLRPCTWYQVDTTPSLLDADARPVTPTTWEFRTGLDAQGTLCPDDPTGYDWLVGAVENPDGDPAGDVTVAAYHRSDGFTPTATTVTDASGAYSFDTFDDLPAGSYRLAFIPPVGSGAAVQWSGGEPSRATATEVDHRGSTTVPTVTLDNSGGVVGRIIGVGDAEVDGLRVGVFSRNLLWVPLGQDDTDPTGRFRIDGLQPGEYWVLVIHPTDPAIPPRWIGGSGTRPAAPAAMVAAGSTDDLGDVILQP